VPWLHSKSEVLVSGEPVLLATLDIHYAKYLFSLREVNRWISEVLQRQANKKGLRTKDEFKLFIFEHIKHFVKRSCGAIGIEQMRWQ
jgi:hypothetical protein